MMEPPLLRGDGLTHRRDPSRFAEKVAFEWSLEAGEIWTDKKTRR